MKFIIIWKFLIIEESKQDAWNEQGKSAIKYLQKNNRHRTMIFRSPIKSKLYLLCLWLEIIHDS